MARGLGGWRRGLEKQFNISFGEEEEAEEGKNEGGNHRSVEAHGGGGGGRLDGVPPFFSTHTYEY